jgi:hypothetical protein
MSVFYGQIVKVEFLLDLSQQVLGWFIKADPYKPVRFSQMVVDGFY